MSKIEMTPEIGMQIKELRLKNKVKSKDLASYISMSPAYISKLEKGDIKKIEDSDLKIIINYITKLENGYESFIEKFTMTMTPEKLTEATWFMNFDMIERKIPIPNSLVSWIKDKMKELDLTSLFLVDYINKNEDLNDDFFKMNNIEKSQFKKNIWYPYSINPNENDIIRHFIFIECDYGKLDSILSGKISKCNYVFIYALVYHILKLASHNTDNEELQKQAEKILLKHKFYRLTDRSKFKRQSQTQTDYQELLSDFDNTNIELINKLLFVIKFLSEKDVEYTNRKLSHIVENLDSFPSFALAYMALSLEPLFKSSSNTKKEFLNKVTELIDLYSAKDDFSSVIEKY